MLNLKLIPLFFWIKFKEIRHKIIMIIKYHINNIFYHLIKNLFNYFNPRKYYNIKSLFAFQINPINLKKNPEGAYGWLNYIFPIISKYSKFKFKYLNDVNFKHYQNYKIDRLLIFFPQGLGYEFSSKLIKSSKKIIFFVNDNVMFCKKSYNTANNKECLRCLKKYNPYNNCDHFPFPSNDSSYINFIKTLKSKSKSILFVCHSSSNVKIINSVFPNSNVIELKNISLEYNKIKVKKSIYKYDFLFHAHKLQSKGYFYFLKIAKENPNLNFFMPDYDLVNNFYHKNIIFDKKNWNKGLQKKIYETKIILCPSFWSANFEGSVLRTMLMGKCCAIIKSANSFSVDIPSNSIIKLSGNIKKDTKLLNNMIKDNSKIEKIGNNARSWALKYIRNNPRKDIKFLDDFFEA